MALRLLADMTVKEQVNIKLVTSLRHVALLDISVVGCKDDDLIKVRSDIIVSQLLTSSKVFA